MRARPGTTLGVLVLLASCGGEPARERTETARSEPLPAATCTPVGLELSHPIAGLFLPEGCTFTTGGTEAAPLVITTQAELDLHLQCAAASAPVIDMTVSDVYIVTVSLSPAHGGSEIRDDGAAITFVTRFRPPCPDDPLPMPIDSTFGFALPKGEVRAFHAASCSLPERC